MPYGQLVSAAAKPIVKMQPVVTEVKCMVTDYKVINSLSQKFIFFCCQAQGRERAAVFSQTQVFGSNHAGRR